MGENEKIDVYNLYQEMEKSNIILSFKGNITADLLTSILEITENKLEKIQEEPRVRRKVFNILVECLQNVYHHMDAMLEEEDGKNGSLGSAKNTVIFMIGKDDNNYFITTGNHMHNEKVDILKSKIDKINGLDAQQIKEFYHETLTQSEGLSEKGGAGLGMIDMARKSGQKIDYDFNKMDDQFTFFSCYIKVAHQ